MVNEGLIVKTSCKIANPGNGKVLVESFDLAGETLFGYTGKVVGYILGRRLFGYCRHG